MTTLAQEIPLPPDELMVLVAGHANHEDFARSRINGPKQILADLNAAGIDPAKLVDVLDFGCGCGRFLAGWVMLGSAMRLHGCDQNPAMVQWCREHIPGAILKVNRLGEEIPFATGSLDFVYLLSVFTHLTVAEQKRLVGEFRRILRPGGYAYVTFHGESYIPELLPKVEGGEEIFRRDGFLIQNESVEGWQGCWTLHSPSYLSALFDGFVAVKHFRSLDRGPTDVASWQDSMIFQVGD